ncbi:MAG: Secreted protein [Nocardioides sp.]|nr:Secreted protein [Nocardioides sp.]
MPAASYAAIDPLPVGTDVDYQLGGAKAMPAHVGIVVRDRAAAPAARRYNVCYVNGFQTQEGEQGFWGRHQDLVLHDAAGQPVEDEAWNEFLLDLRTADKRVALAKIVGRWVRGCAEDGFDAVEFDNLDSFTRSDGLLKRKQAIAYATLLVKKAHGSGLAAGQKNLAGFDGTRVGYDFAVSEECGRYDECASYVAHYGRRVLAIEYRRQDFRSTCDQFGSRLAVVLRNRALSPGGVHRWC